MRSAFLSIIFVMMISFPSIGVTEESAIFPEYKLSELILESLDTATSSLVIKNKKGDQVRGYVGDFLGIEQAQVVEITDSNILIETIEYVENEDGGQNEQPSRMRIPLSFLTYGHGKTLLR